MDAQEAPVAEPLPAVDDRKAQLIRRGLFPYHDGVRDRLADIIVVQMKLQQASPGRDVNHLDDLLRIGSGADEGPTADGEASAPTLTPDPTGPRLTPYEALVELGRLVGVAFDLPPLDEATGVGLSTQERVDLISDYLSAPVGDPDEGDDADEGRPDGAAPGDGPRMAGGAGTAGLFDVPSTGPTGP